MNSFAGMSQTTKTFDNMCQVKKSGDAISMYNDGYKNQRDALDPNIFETTNHDDGGSLQIDYDKDKNTQQQIVVQTSKINLMADPQNIMQMNQLDDSNPIFHDGRLRQEQRSNRVVEHKENAVQQPTDGSDFQSKVLQQNAELNRVQAMKTQKKMLSQRTQEVQRPRKLGEFKQTMPDYALMKQQGERTTKAIYDIDQFQARGNKDLDPKKRGILIPKMGPQLQHFVTVPQEKANQIFTSQRNKIHEIMNMKTANIAEVNHDIDIPRMIMLQRKMGNFVQMNFRQPQLDDRVQEKSSLTTLLHTITKPVQMAVNTFMPHKNVSRPAPEMYTNPQKAFFNPQMNRLGGVANQITSATDIRPIHTNYPRFQEMATKTNQSMNRTKKDNSVSQYGEFNMGTTTY